MGEKQKVGNILSDVQNVELCKQIYIILQKKKELIDGIGGRRNDQED